MFLFLLPELPWVYFRINILTLYHHPKMLPSALTVWLAAAIVSVITGVTPWNTGMSNTYTRSKLTQVAGPMALSGQGQSGGRLWGVGVTGTPASSGCQVYCTTAGRKVEVLGASARREMGSQDPVSLLPSSLWQSASLQPGGWSHLCHLSCCCWVLSCCSQRGGGQDYMHCLCSSPVLPPLCVPLGAQMCRTLEL